MPSGLPAYELYARLLFPLGYGHPLWGFPSDERPIQLGDVGRLLQGKFHRLFNTTEQQDHESDIPFPEDFQPLAMKNMILQELKLPSGPFLHSSSVTDTKFDMADREAATIRASAKLTERSAALLMLAPATTRTIMSKRRIVAYMKEHYNSWVALAETSGFDADDLILITGTTTTAACGALAFTLPDSNSRGEGTETPQLSVSWDSREGMMRAEVDGTDIVGRDTCRTGVAPESEGAQSAEGPLCVFVHYYKMKRRFWWSRAIRAAAGPHEFPKGREDEDPPRVCAGCDRDEEDEEPVERHDPVDDVLNYILENSSAHTAIASTHDVCELLQKYGHDASELVVAVLNRAAPRVELDKDGMGTLLIEETQNAPSAALISNMPILRQAGCCSSFQPRWYTESGARSMAVAVC
ncbi:hypothetical protein L227DRAFT_572706 [Lentinus tigrinus ALCF2SS1-6]|uniref:Uncharacterized protein n=1 Tax=Lentinus tigrinus ALCF2SS1-6 TaxID=1328759 RepID=A0A5C2SIE6_9APHY|nr:hypothetical protein L227DRAFT_572706 [Lentinus tigrinus ALCF2SS1-6]